MILFISPLILSRGSYNTSNLSTHRWVLLVNGIPWLLIMLLQLVFLLFLLFELFKLLPRIREIIHDHPACICQCIITSRLKCRSLILLRLWRWLVDLGLRLMCLRKRRLTHWNYVLLRLDIIHLIVVNHCIIVIYYCRLRVFLQSFCISKSVNSVVSTGAAWRDTSDHDDASTFRLHHERISQYHRQLRSSKRDMNFIITMFFHVKTSNTFFQSQ